MYVGIRNEEEQKGRRGEGRCVKRDDRCNIVKVGKGTCVWMVVCGHDGCNYHTITVDLHRWI